jgi:hypothetical protein
VLAVDHRELHLFDADGAAIPLRHAHLAS